MAPPPAGQRILLVDDAPGVRMTMAALLEDAGYAVDEAESLAQARGFLRTSTYHLAILDVELGDGRGTDLVPDLALAHPATYIAILSGGELEPTGAVSLVFKKASDPDEMIRRIGVLLSKEAAP